MDRPIRRRSATTSIYNSSHRGAENIAPSSLRSEIHNSSNNNPPMLERRRRYSRRLYSMNNPNQMSKPAMTSVTSDSALRRLQDDSNNATVKSSDSAQTLTQLSQKNSLIGSGTMSDRTPSSFNWSDLSVNYPSISSDDTNKNLNPLSSRIVREYIAKVTTTIQQYEPDSTADLTASSEWGSLPNLFAISYPSVMSTVITSCHKSPAITRQGGASPIALPLPGWPSSPGKVVRRAYMTDAGPGGSESSNEISEARDYQSDNIHSIDWAEWETRKLNKVGRQLENQLHLQSGHSSVSSLASAPGDVCGDACADLMRRGVTASPSMSKFDVSTVYEGLPRRPSKSTTTLLSSRKPHSRYPDGSLTVPASTPTELNSSTESLRATGQSTPRRHQMSSTSSSGLGRSLFRNMLHLPQAASTVSMPGAVSQSQPSSRSSFRSTGCASPASLNEDNGDYIYTTHSKARKGRVAALADSIISPVTF